MKFLNWIKKHIVASVAIVVFTIAIAVSAYGLRLTFTQSFSPPLVY